MIKRILAIVTTSSMCLHAVIIQHDTPVESYKTFAKHPFFDGVGLLKTNSGSCTGILVDERTILTARHCLNNFTPQPGNTFSLSTVRKGKLGASDNPIHIMGVRKPAENKPVPTPDFPDYFFGAAQDLAVVYLKNPIFLSTYPLLAQSPVPPPITPDKKFLIGGYGRFGYAHRRGTDPAVEKLAGITHVDSYKIFEDHPGTIPYVSIETSFLHEGTGQVGASTTFGDSGGPLFMVGGKDTTPMLLGLVSRMIAKSPLQLDGSRYHQDAKDYLMNKIKIEGRQVTLFKADEPLGTQQDSFLGYLTKRFFTYVGGFNGFIRESKAVIEAVSDSNSNKLHPFWWSQQERWHFNTSRWLPQNCAVNNNPHQQDSNGALPTFFKASIKGFVYADKTVTVDALSINHPNSHLQIMHGVELTSHKTSLENGAHLHVDGTLITKPFILNSGKISGQGLIRLYSDPYVLQPFDVYKPSTIFQNDGGHIDLSNHVSKLGIDGNYVHGADAQLTVRVGEMGASTLAIRKRATIYGGTLNIYVGNLSMSSSRMTGPSIKKWTIMTAKAGIKGCFANVIPNANSSINFPISLQVKYSKHSVEVEIKY